MNPSFLSHLLVKDDLFLHLRNHRVGGFYFMLHSLIFLEVLVEFSLEFGKIALLLLSRSVDWLHGFKGYLGQGSTIACFVDIVIKNTHLVTVSKVRLYFALDS